jgi:hypothetical protein
MFIKHGQNTLLASNIYGENRYSRRTPFTQAFRTLSASGSGLTTFASDVIGLDNIVLSLFILLLDVANVTP